MVKQKLHAQTGILWNVDEVEIHEVSQEAQEVVHLDFIQSHRLSEDLDSMQSFIQRRLNGIRLERRDQVSPEELDADGMVFSESLIHVHQEFLFDDELHDFIPLRRC